MLPGAVWAPLRFLSGRDKNSLAAAYASIVISLRKRSKMRIRWDGEDWCHSWSGGKLVTFRPFPDAEKEGMADLPLFFYDYSPGPGDTVIDVGAGIGTELAVLSQMVGRDGRVIAIEADPVAFRRLRKLNESLGLVNTTLVQSAVAHFEGELFLTQDDADAIGNHLTESQTPDAIRVPVTTLDHLVASLRLEKVDYVKMNIEGAERDALKGFLSYSNLVKHWCISCHDFKETEWAQTFDFVNDWFEARGLQPKKHPEIAGLSHAGYYVYV